MRNARGFAWIFAGLLACLPAAQAAQGADSAADRIRLSVLYVGEPQTKRTSDFVTFLEKHFTKVAQQDLTKFREKDVEGYDAVIMDLGGVVVKDNRIHMPAMPQMPPFGATYSRPTVMVGATDALVSGRMGLKTGYM